MCKTLASPEGHAMSIYFRPIILNAFPETTWPPIRRCAVIGVSLADALIERERMLDWAVGQDQRGDLRRIGVMWKIAQACKDGELPFECSTKENTVKNCHHIEISSQRVYAHVTKTSSLRAMPRETTLRDNERVNNQGDLFDNKEFTTDLTEIKKWYAWIMFNADERGNLSHLAIGLPKARENAWLDLISILGGKIEKLSGPEEERRPPPPEEIMKFREEIKEVPKVSSRVHEKKEK